jgi:hypothetical protein
MNSAACVTELMFLITPSWHVITFTSLSASSGMNRGTTLVANRTGVVTSRRISFEFYISVAVAKDKKRGFVVQVLRGPK